MRTRTLIFLSLLVSQIAQAASNCSEPSARYEDLGCASELLAKADKSLNMAYQSLLADLDQEAKEKLKLAQRAWVQFRDADKAFAYANSGEGGSLGALISTNHVLDRKRSAVPR